MTFSTLPPTAIKTGSTQEDFTKLQWTDKRGGTSTYKGGRYCGPGWGFTYKDILSGKIKQLPEAVDAIDEACKLHDYCYEENGYLTQGCNLVLTVDLVKVINDDKSTPQQRADATIMAAIFFIESQTVDVGVLAYREVINLKQKLEGMLTVQTMTLEQAITNTLMRGCL